MKLIVGLGNPGKEYETTRHNAGFIVMDEICKKLGCTLKSSKFLCEMEKVNIDGIPTILCKPMTYMNLSGNAVIQLVQYYHIDLEDILIMHDDMDLPVGKIRIRQKGSSGGQNGMKHIINVLHSDEIKRIRIGVDHDRSKDVKDYVLSSVSKQDFPKFQESILLARDAAMSFVSKPFQIVMNEFNTKGNIK